MDNNNNNSYKLCFHINQYVWKVSYINQTTGTVELLDYTGGYDVPTILNIAGLVDDEWIFGKEVYTYSFMPNIFVIDDLLNSAIDEKTFNINEKTVEAKKVLEELLHFFKDSIFELNPKAVISDIVIVKLDGNDITKVLDCFENVFENANITFEDKIKCILSDFAMKNNINNTVLIDIDDDIFSVSKITIDDEIKVNKIIENESLSINKIYTKLYDYVYRACIDNGYDNPNSFEIKNFIEENKERIFHKNILKKSIKVYFSFAPKPFYIKINIDFIRSIFFEYLEELEKTLKSMNAYFYIGSGKGFEISFIKEVLIKHFEINVMQSSYYNVVYGGAYLLTDNIQVQSLKNKNVKKDLIKEIGFKNNNKFIKIVQQNNSKTKYFIILDEYIENYDLNLYLKEGETISKLQTICLDNLPKRDKGTLRLKVYANFENNELHITFSDVGFGEFYDKTAYDRSFVIHIK